MNFDWPILPLEDCLDALIDYRGKTPVKTTSGIPLITAKIIKSGRIEKPTEFIALDNYEAWMRRGIPNEGDVVLTVEAPLGEVAQLGSEKVALAQRVVTLRGKKEVLDSTYLLYLLQTEEMQDKLKARATGTTVLGIKQSELRKIPISIPPLNIQENAAETLKAIDKRIELQSETIKTLEDICQAIFRSWFIDFEPVLNQDESYSKSISSFFPNETIESDLGMIPKDWKISTLSNLAKIKGGKMLDREHFLANGLYPIFGGAGVMGKTDLSNADGFVITAN